MENFQLRYFVAVAKNQSFSRAASICHVSQPSLSQQIAKLEKELGRKLFHRLGKRVVLTSAGQSLYKSATEILKLVDDTTIKLQNESDHSDQQLNIGVIPTIAPYLLPPVLKEFSSRFPNIELTIHENVTKDLLEATAEGEMDFSIVALPIEDDRLHKEVLFKEKLLLALPPHHRLMGKKQLKFQHLKDERFIILSEMHCLSEHVLAFCRVNNYSPNIACRSAQITTIQALISNGQGVSLLPEMSRNYDERTCEYRELSYHNLHRTVAAVWHRQRFRTQAEEALVEILKKGIKNQNQNQQD